MIKDCGVQWVILGHSERRHVFGESDEVTLIILSLFCALIFMCSNYVKRKNLPFFLGAHIVIRHIFTCMLLAYRPEDGPRSGERPRRHRLHWRKAG